MDLSNTLRHLIQLSGKRINPFEDNKKAKVVSYSQFSQFAKCPRQWFLGYALKLRKREPNIHLVFGNAMHTVIQEFLYLREDDKIDGYDYESRLFNEIYSEYEKSKDEYKEHFSTPEILEEFYQDGVEILKEFVQSVDDIYPRDRYVHVSNEFPLYFNPVEKIDNVVMSAYLDLVFFDKIEEKFVIDDLKTSTKGWSHYQRSDQTKIAQVRLYKGFFSELYNVPMEKITCRFVILIRKSFPGRPRVDIFTPHQNEDSCVQSTAEFRDFVFTGFKLSGDYNMDFEYPALTGGEKSPNCRFCDFKDDFEKCPLNNRI